MSERNEPVDPRHEEALAAALRAHAESVRPAGDGLIRIRARVERRRLRSRFLIPVATAGTVAATVTAVVASGMLAGSSGKPSVSALETTSLAAVTTAAKPSPKAATPSPAVSAQHSVSAQPSAAVATSAAVVVSSAVATSASPTVTSLVAAGGPPYPVPVWPFADKTAAEAWQQKPATPGDLWHLDARATAERFVGSLQLPQMSLGGTAPKIAGDGTATVDVFRTETSTGKQVTLGTVTLAHWTTGASAPWGVVGMTNATPGLPLQITSPTPESAVTSPLSVTFTLSGAEDDVFVSAWSAGGGLSGPPTHLVTGIGDTTSLSGGLPATGRGYVVVADGSSGQGTFAVGRLAVTPVNFGTATAGASTYLAVVQKADGGEVQLFDATTGALIRTLAKPKPFNLAEVTADSTWAYYGDIVDGHWTCGQPLERVRRDGSGSPESVVMAAAGTSVYNLAIGGPHGTVQAWVQKPCGTGQLTSATILWRNTATGASGTIVSPGDPPDPETLAVSPDGKQISAFVRNGTSGNVETFNLATARDINQNSVPSGCLSDGSFECVAATYAPNGDLVLVRSDGQLLTLVRLHAGHTSTLFSVPAAGQVAHVDMDPSGQQVLLTAENGHAWIWGGSGKARVLPGQVSDASW